ncbi:hypothetical protein C8J56DRAFT_1168364 [Mycena floridula]|nr:hypothetical protein C8J56DRAFT_1168364 [Mycena floridula]
MAQIIPEDNAFGIEGGSFGGFVMSNNTISNHYTVNSTTMATSTDPSYLGLPNPLACGYIPAAPLLYGRDTEIKSIVEYLTRNPDTAESKRARFAILGTIGMGKTALALKVMQDAQLLACYLQYCLAWLPCIQATSFSFLVNTVRAALGLRANDTENAHHAIIDELNSSSNPIILLFDNFETPWNVPVAPCEEINWREMRIAPLQPEAAIQLYTAIDQKAQDEEELSELLEMLGHMPLAIKLMARTGRFMAGTVRQLIECYHKMGTAMLGPSKASDAQNSVSISISLSLDSPQIRREPDAYKLLSRISMLPSGTTFQALEELWALDIRHLPAAVEALLEVALLECRAGTYFVLPVIQTHMLHSESAVQVSKLSMTKAACNFLTKHSCVTPGETSYEYDAAQRSIQEINLQVILLQSSSSETEFIQALLTLAWHQYRTNPRLEVIEHAEQYTRGAEDQNLRGRVLECYGSVLHSLNHFDEALLQFEHARQTYLRVSNFRLAGLMLLEIAVLRALLDSTSNQIPLIKQAQHELKPNHWQHFFRLKEDLEKCLQHLGQEYSRCGQHSKAIVYLLKARNLSPNLSSGARCAQSLALAYYHLQQYNDAEKWGLLALTEQREMNHHNLGDVLRLIGMIYISNGQYSLAIELLKETLESAQAHNDELNAGYALLELGKAYVEKGEADDARVSFTEALAHFGQFRNMSGEMDKCRFYLEKLGDSSWSLTEEKRFLVTNHAANTAVAETALPPESGPDFTGMKLQRTNVSGDHPWEAFIVGAVDALAQIQVKMPEIISLMKSHQLSTKDFIVRPGFDESLIMRGVGHLQQIFVSILSLKSTPSRTLIVGLGKIFSPYPGTLLIHSQILRIPVFKESGEEWDFDDLVISRVERLNERGIRSSTSPHTWMTVMSPGSGTAHDENPSFSSGQGNSSSGGSGHGARDEGHGEGKRNGSDPNNGDKGKGKERDDGDNGGGGGGGGGPEPGSSKHAARMARAYFSTTTEIFCQNSDQHFQEMQTEGVVLTKHLGAQSCCVDIKRLNFQSQPFTGISTSAYRQCLVHVTINSTCGNMARASEYHPRSTADSDPQVKQSSSKEISWIGQFITAGKSILAIPTLEMTASASRAIKTASASERMRNTARITQRHSRGNISWHFSVTDPNLQQNGLEFPDDLLPKVEFEMLDIPLPDSVFVEVASYWTIPFPTKWMWSSGTSKEPLFQNICHVVAMRLPSNLTQSSNYVATLQKGLQHDKLEKIVEQGSPQVLPAILRFEPGDDDHMHQIDAVPTILPALVTHTSRALVLAPEAVTGPSDGPAATVSDSQRGKDDVQVPTARLSTSETNINDDQSSQGKGKEIAR